MSPTAIYRPVLDGHDGCMLGAGGGGVPGVWGMGGWLGRAIPVPSPVPSQDPYLTLFDLRAYLRPNEGNIPVFDEVS